MSNTGTGRVIKVNEGRTRFVTIPADVAKDDRFPFADNEEVKVSIVKASLRIEKISCEHDWSYEGVEGEKEIWRCRICNKIKTQPYTGAIDTVEGYDTSKK